MDTYQQKSESDLKAEIDAWKQEIAAPAEVTEIKHRTNAQNASMWVACRLLAQEFTERGLDMQVVLDKAKFPIQWNEKSVQSAIFNEISKAMYKETSSGLETKDPSKVWDVVRDFTEKNWQFSIPWPSNQPPMMGGDE